MRRKVLAALVVLAWSGSARVASGFQVVSTIPARHVFAASTTSVAVTFDQPLQVSTITASPFPTVW
mgnify:CR=1 FL=1